MSDNTQNVIIKPPNDLRQKVRPSMTSAKELMARAEEAVAKLAEDYKSWVEGDVERLEQAFAAAAGADDRQVPFEAILHTAHEIRGQGGTFGYELLTQVAGSLYTFVSACKHKQVDGDAMALIALHIHTIKNIVRHQVQGDGEAMDQDVAHGLEAAVAKTLQRLSISVD